MPRLEIARRKVSLAGVAVLLAGCASPSASPLSPDADASCADPTYPDWATSPYVLPYPVGETHQVRLNNCSSSYHSAGTPDEFATDFAMPVGTIIVASRAGTVEFVRESGFDYDQPNNLVVVHHGDGTYAQYMHLTRNGASVEAGEAVAQGDTIGLSGATGLAGYPHLHFVVTTADWAWPYNSIPVSFSNTTPNPHGLESGTEYEALAY